MYIISRIVEYQCFKKLHQQYSYMLTLIVKLYLGWNPWRKIQQKDSFNTMSTVRRSSCCYNNIKKAKEECYNNSHHTSFTQTNTMCCSDCVSLVWGSYLGRQLEPQWEDVLFFCHQLRTNGRSDPRAASLLWRLSVFCFNGFHISVLQTQRSSDFRLTAAAAPRTTIRKRYEYF